MTDRDLLELLVQKVTGIEAKLTEHDKRFDEIDKRFAEVDKRFDEVDKRFAKVDKRFDEVDKRFAKVDKRFDEVDKRFAGVDQRFAKIDAEISDIKTTLNRIETRQNAIFEQTAGLLEFRTEMLKSVQELQENQKSLCEIVGEHEMYIRSLRRRSV